MRFILALCACTFSTVALADRDQGWYLGLGGKYIDSGVLSDSGSSIGFSSVDIYTGYKHSRILGAELRGGASVNDAESFGTEFSIPMFYSLYYRAEISNDVAKSFVLLGYTDIEVEAALSGSAETVTANDSGLSWGAGIGFVVNERVNLNFEYINLISNDDNEFESVGVSLDFRF